MNSNNLVACPLDCYDTCQGCVDEKGNIKGSSEHLVTNKKLCVNFANLLKEDFLKKAFYKDEEVNLEKALDILVEKLKNTNSDKSLFYKGAGNLGVMQNSVKTFFAKYGSTLTKGSLCDAIGSLGIEQGREGINVNPPIEKLINSDIVIVWGRNLTVTSAHIYNLVKDKTFITIDPLKTKIAKKSELHLQINPKTDHDLALLLTRFAHMSNQEDEEFISSHEGADWFFDLAKSKPVVSYEQTTGVNLSQITKFFELIEGKSVSILLGLGPQKYYEGAQIFRTIDSFAAYIGVHNKEKGGLWYLDDSSYGYDKQLVSKAKKKIPLPTVDFSKFDLVFIQGTDPVVTAPNTKKVIEGLKNSFVVFFGTVLNETSKYADLIIPSSSFLTKKDVRLSYGHELKAISNYTELKDENTISEYELANFLNENFGFEKLEDEEKILDYYINTKVKDNSYIEKFEFIEELEINELYENKKDKQYYFLTAKRKESLNSQFKVDNHLYVNPCLGFQDGDEVLLKSEYGETKIKIKNSEDIKENCVLAYSGNKYANYVTPFLTDQEADSAIFQEVLVEIELS
ncbi:MAG: molybdopterin-dependent oxidoreductase [Campylobacteraceae bacterium]|nr:molybdopterin-dependent oxidoreductase [Campylobacteraceae bacterium]